MKKLLILLLCSVQRGNKILPSSTAFAKQWKAACVVLLCSVLVGCATNYQKIDSTDSQSLDIKTQVRRYYDFLTALKTNMSEEEVFLLAEDLIEEEIITLDKDVFIMGDTKMVTWRGRYPYSFSLTFTNDELVMWNY